MVAYLFRLVLVFPSICLAWGTEGHQIVGKIAAEYLTEAARREVTILLEGDLDGTGAPSGRTTLAEIGIQTDPYLGTGVSCTRKS